MQHIISCLVENNPGVLARIAGLFCGRGYNIDTLNVAETEDPTMSRMTMVAAGDDRIIEQILKQLNKLVDVIKVSDLTTERYIDRELVLVKVSAPAERRVELKELIAMIDAEIVAVQTKSAIVQMAGNQEQVRDLVELLKPFKILDISRSGVTAVAKGD